MANKTKCFQPGSSCLAHEACLELEMKPFDQPIGTRVVGSGPGMGDAEESHQVFPQTALKLSPSVRSEGGWDAKSCDLTKQECLGHCFHAGVSEQDDFWPTSEAIHAGE